MNRKKYLFLVIACNMAFCFSLFADKSYTPKLGSPERKEICDIIRASDVFEDFPEMKIEFVVEFLTIDGKWAGFAGLPQDKKTGEQLDMMCTALLFKNGKGKWEVKTVFLHSDILFPAEFTEGALVPISVYPDHIVETEIYRRKEKAEDEKG